MELPCFIFQKINKLVTSSTFSFFPNNMNAYSADSQESVYSEIASQIIF